MRSSSSSSRRRNVVKPGRIDAVLGHDRNGLRLNFGLAMQQQRSFTVSSSSTSGSQRQSGHREGHGGVRADSSEPLSLSGSLSQGGCSQGFPGHSQGVTLSQGSASQGGLQSQSETGGFSMSQPSPDLLAPYGHSGGIGTRPYFTSGSGGLGDTGSRDSQEMGPVKVRKSTKQYGQGVGTQESATGSTTSSKARRPQPLSQDGTRDQRLLFAHGGSKPAPSSIGRGAATEKGATDAFERLLSEQFRTQVMSELRDIRILAETTRDTVAKLGKENEQMSTALRDVQQELQATHEAVQTVSEASSKAANFLEGTMPETFSTLEKRLRSFEERVSAATETAATTAVSAQEASTAAMGAIKEAMSSMVSAASSSSQRPGNSARSHDSYSRTSPDLQQGMRPVLGGARDAMGSPRAQSIVEGVEVDGYERGRRRYADDVGGVLVVSAKKGTNGDSSTRGATLCAIRATQNVYAIEAGRGCNTSHTPEGRDVDGSSRGSSVETNPEWSEYDASLRWTQPWGGRKKKLRGNRPGSTDISEAPLDSSRHQSNFRDARGSTTTTRSLRSHTTRKNDTAVTDHSPANLDSLNTFEDNLAAVAARASRSPAAGRGYRSAARGPRRGRLPPASSTPSTRMSTSGDDVSHRKHSLRSEKRDFDDGIISRATRSTRSSVEGGTIASGRTRAAASTSSTAPRRSSPIGIRGRTTVTISKRGSRSSRSTATERQHQGIPTKTANDLHQAGRPLLIAPPTIPPRAASTTTGFQSDDFTGARQVERNLDPATGYSPSNTLRIGSIPRASSTIPPTFVAEPGGDRGSRRGRGGGGVEGRRTMPMPAADVGGDDDGVFSVHHMGREEDDSFGGAGGLTVEAYMARKRQTKRSSSIVRSTVSLSARKTSRRTPMPPPKAKQAAATPQKKIKPTPKRSSPRTPSPCRSRSSVGRRRGNDPGLAMEKASASGGPRSRSPANESFSGNSGWLIEGESGW